LEAQMTSTITPSSELARRHPVPPGVFTYEPSERHVRGTIGSVTLVNSYSAVLVWEPGQAVPGYVFPRADVREDLLRPTSAPTHGRHQGAGKFYDVEVDGALYPALAFEYDVEGLEGHIAIDWMRREEPGVEHWYEEAEEIFRHPRDPYKRVDPIPSDRHVEVFVDGLKIADTQRPVLLFETRLPIRYYIPAEDIDFTHLVETDLSSTCPYKGDARYWSVQTPERLRENIVWAYADPVRAAAPIKDHLALYNEVVDIVVEGVPLQRPESEFTASLSSRNA
jgi:uncharacterized protein (DUF427 family)